MYRCSMHSHAGSPIHIYWNAEVSRTQPLVPMPCGWHICIPVLSMFEAMPACHLHACMQMDRTPANLVQAKTPIHGRVQIVMPMWRRQYTSCSGFWDKRWTTACRGWECGSEIHQQWQGIELCLGIVPSNSFLIKNSNKMKARSFEYKKAGV